jgi:signal peptidase I
VEVSCELLAQGYGVRFRASGASMQPSICDGDLITIAPATATSATAGTVILYRRLGRLLAHRVVSAGFDTSGRRRVLVRGDASTVCDAPVSPAQIVGELVDVNRASAPSIRFVPGLLGRVLRSCRQLAVGA